MTAARKLRVALFVNDLMSMGGIQRVAVSLARDLDDAFDTSIITLFEGHKVFDEPGIPHCSLNLPFHDGKFYPSLRELVVIGRRLRRVARAQEIDVVICFWFHLAIVGAFALPARVTKIGYEHIAFAGATGFWSTARRLAYPRLDAVVSLAQEDSADFSRISRRAEVIPNYTMLPTPGDGKAREKIILAVGHIEYRKGLDRLLWALKGPLQAHPDWRLVFVGGGDSGREERWFIPYLHALIGLLGLAERVDLYPATPHIDRWYRRASIMALGSRREGFPMVLLEAKAHGLPVISYDCPTGPREIVRHGIDGFVVKTESDFTQAAHSLMSDGLLLRRMSESAVEDVRSRFLREHVCARWRDLIVSARAGPSQVGRSKYLAARGISS